MAKVLEIVKLNGECDGVLRQHARPVENLSQWQGLIDDMKETLAHSGGVGIAAPQVGMPYRIIIIHSKPTSRYPKAPELGPLVMINPIMHCWPEGEEEGWEGCLSVPDEYGLVSRYIHVTVGYTTEKGEGKTISLRDFPARICQHEVDHLNGILFPFLAKKIISKKEYQEMIARDRDKQK